MQTDRDALLDVLKTNVDDWNAWRAANRDVGVDLAGADLRDVHLAGADLEGAVLQGATLRGANLTGANLHDADLRRANLRNAVLAGADLQGAQMYRANLNRASLRGADLRGADLYRVFLKRTDLTLADLRGVDMRVSVLTETRIDGARLSGARVYGIAAWGLQGRPADQQDLVITSDNEPVVTVDNLNVAQFIYLLLNNEEIRGVIDTITSKVVLILGRFTVERKAVLDRLRDAFRQRDLSPVVFDFEIPQDRDITETVTLLARMARYVVADLTDPRSIPQEIQAVAPDVAVPIQPIVLAGQESWSMFSDLRRKYHWVLEPYTYRDAAHLLGTLDRLLGVLEAKRSELSAR